ncbi:MAG: hypothetical protein Q9178_002668 [Gyalolechia marmorata]
MLHELGPGGGSLEGLLTSGGVVSACIAHYLIQHPRYHPKPTGVSILEASSIGGGASGKAGSIIATCGDLACIAPLSYRLHCELSNQHNGVDAWGLRNIHSADVDAMGEDVGHAMPEASRAHFHSHTVSKPSNKKHPPKLDWITPESITSYNRTRIVRLAQDRGVRLILGSAIRLNYSENGSCAKSVSYRSEEPLGRSDIYASDMVIAAGPWTTKLLPHAPLTESWNHSVVVRPQKLVSAYVLFPELNPKMPQKRRPPEIFQVSRS